MKEEKARCEQKTEVRSAVEAAVGLFARSEACPQDASKKPFPRLRAAFSARSMPERRSGSTTRRPGAMTPPVRRRRHAKATPLLPPDVPTKVMTERRNGTASGPVAARLLGPEFAPGQSMNCR